MIYAGVPSFFGLGLEGRSGSCSNFLASPILYFSTTQSRGRPHKKNPPLGSRIYTIGVVESRIGGYYIIYYTMLYYNIPYYTIL